MVEPGGKAFPYFFVGTFIEAIGGSSAFEDAVEFPYFFVGTFIEAGVVGVGRSGSRDFPTFS